MHTHGQRYVRMVNACMRICMNACTGLVGFFYYLSYLERDFFSKASLMSLFSLLKVHLYKLIFSNRGPTWFLACTILVAILLIKHKTLAHKIPYFWLDSPLYFIIFFFNEKKGVGKAINVTILLEHDHNRTILIGFKALPFFQTPHSHNQGPLIYL